MNCLKSALGFVVAGVLVASVSINGQERVPATSRSAVKPAATTEPAKVALPKKPKGRLPNYFSAIVTSEQRDEIYTIQARYNAQIADLEKQLSALKAELGEAVDGVLTPEQLAEVSKKRSSAKTSRKRPPAKKAASGSDS